MKEGDVLLTSLGQADGAMMNRPVLFLRQMPPYQDFLVCGVSSQLDQAVPDFDELITSQDANFRTSGLKSSSVIRLDYLAVLPRTQFKGRIGSVSSARLKRQLMNLADFLRPQSK